ncbi:MAG TPA: DUF3109 family protein [Bacteroidales bacterium]|nr:DUF3109 family protein [Bacteroidales bacterium]
MLRINNTIFSLDILEKKFVCDLQHCYGNCCRYGDSGAPVTEEEAAKLEQIWTVVKSYLKPAGVESIERSGTTIFDIDNDHVTPLIDNKECAYSVMEGNIFKCGIEMAWKDGKIDFQKPLSCHLFPAKIKQFTDFKAVNYSEQPVCAEARRMGQKEGVYVYEFLKEPLVRALGDDMYEELCIAAKELRKSNNKR